MCQKILLWLLLTCSLATQAAGPNTSPLSVGWPEQAWITRESQHFIVHAPSNLKEYLPRVAKLAENAHQQLSVELDWQPKAKTHLVLTDDYDLANGWASIYPFNQNRLYISHPDRFTNLEAYDDWLRLLIEHEYTHTLHLDQAEGGPAALRQVFGRVPLFFPHLFQPLWLLEGLAMRAETDHEAGVGRGQSSLQALRMRAEVEAGLISLSRVSGQNRDWPPDQAYLYGVYFYQFLDETLGPEAVQTWLQTYRRNLFPFLLNSTARRSLGKSFPELWGDYQHWLEERFTPLNSPYPQGHPLTTKGLNEAPPASNGKQVYRLESSRHGPTRLQLHQPGQVTKTLTRLEGQGLIDVNQQGQVVISRYQQRRDNRLYSDLWLWDEQSGLKRLTSGQRYRQARWLGEEELLARKQVAGISSLDLLDHQGRFKKTLWQGKEREVLGDFSVSPNGRYLAASLKPPGQSWQLALLDLTNGSWQLLTHNNSLQGQPSFSPDGQSLLFTADYTGVYNLYRWNLETGTSTQLTDHNLGAFTPVELETGELIFQSYSSQGYDLHYLTADELLKQPVQLDRLPLLQPREAPPETQLSNERAYRPWSSLRPRYWLPVFYADNDRTELGLMTSGADALGRHQYDLLAAWDTRIDEPFGRFSYQLDNRYQVLLARELKHYSSADGLPVLSRHQDSISLARLNLWNWDQDRLAIHLGLFLEQEKDLWRHQDLASGSTDFRQDLGLALHWDRRYSSQDNISPTRGFQWLLTTETHEGLSNDRAGQRYQFDGKHYWHLGQSHALALRLAAAYAESEAQPFWLGSDSGLSPQALFGRDTYALRGYSKDQFTTNQFALTNLEYHFPLARIQQNWGIYPLGIRDIYGQVFVDHAEIDSTSESHGYTGFGAQITLELVIGFQALLPVEIGYALGLDQEQGEEQWWVKAGVSF
ncbi:WD40-like Beta Propeller Repeat [Marinospirillum celere]|uniref:WD40-like Beta Propeller Repeat n=1 Tax=Marinospirillum celere TaxID=1122252 RepID=A0A1I1IQZ0_9GAMM|nr:PD40 domain-containing protein [Marinospirillum celere]SFC38645.1 WD40-like Beta Propeller Repeat [Marinospirillum celere]